jgi:hypothetical protein
MVLPTRPWDEIAGITDRQRSTRMPDDARRVNDRAAHGSEPPIGAVMKDGTVFAGISPDTGKAMFATPSDSSLTLTFNEAKDYVQGWNMLKALGHNDWRVPTKSELNVLFNNRAAIGGFDESGSDTSWYRTSSPSPWFHAWSQRFSDGHQKHYGKCHPSSVRLVRTDL